MSERIKDVDWREGTTGPLNLDDCDRWPARQSDPLSACLYMTPEKRWVLDAGSVALEILSERAGDLLLSWGWNLPSALIIPWHQAQRAREPSSLILPLPPLVLGKLTETPYIFGKPKECLSVVRYEVIKTLYDAGETGLGKDDLARTSRHTDARRVLKRLSRRDKDWASVIIMPGTPGRRYRVLCRA